MKKSPYVSVQAKKAVECAWQEAREKIEQSYCTIYKWKDIENTYPKSLKILPIAAMPHKSRLCRLILNLVFGIKMKGTKNKIGE